MYYLVLIYSWFAESRPEWKHRKKTGSFVPSEAVFIDNVSDGSTKKRQRQLGQNGPKTAWLISSALRDMSASGKNVQAWKVAMFSIYFW